MPNGWGPSKLPTTLIAHAVLSSEDPTSASGLWRIRWILHAPGSKLSKETFNMDLACQWLLLDPLQMAKRKEVDTPVWSHRILASPLRSMLCKFRNVQGIRREVLACDKADQLTVLGVRRDQPDS